MLISDLITTLHNTLSLLNILERPTTFLGLEAHVSSHSQSITLTQSKYAKEILLKANLASCKPFFIALCSSDKLSFADSPAFEHPSLYRSIIGALQYLTLTCPDISFSINKLSQSLRASTHNHWRACKQVLTYIHGTISFDLSFSPIFYFRLHGFIDADYASSIDDRHSTSRFCIMLGRNMLSWSSRKQSAVAGSNVEVEYRALAFATTDILWLQSLLTELQVSFTAPSLFCGYHHCLQSSVSLSDQTHRLSIHHNNFFVLQSIHLSLLLMSCMLMYGQNLWD